MNDAERDIVRAWWIAGTSKVDTSGRFAAQIRPHISDRAAVVQAFLQEALESRDSDDVELAMTVGYRSGWDHRHVPVLCALAVEPWHRMHENIIFVLDKDLRDPRSIPAFVWATQNVPDYLANDEFRALAVKAIWGLGLLKHPAADAELEKLAQSEHPILRTNAMEQLARRRAT